MIKLEGLELQVGVQIEAAGFSAHRGSSHMFDFGASNDVRVEFTLMDCKLKVEMEASAVGVVVEQHMYPSVSS